MVQLVNYGRRFRNKEEEIEQIRRADGVPTSSGKELKWVELRHKKNAEHPESVKGFQDTRIDINREGEITVAHKDEGRGSLYFAPDRYNTRTAFIAYTPWNVNLLVKHYGSCNWTIVDKDIRKDIETKYRAWWDSLSPKEQRDIRRIREYGSRRALEVPSRTDVNPNKDNSVDLLMQELADTRAQLEALKKGGQEDGREIELKTIDAMPISELRKRVIEKFGKLDGFEYNLKWNKEQLKNILASEDPRHLVSEYDNS